MTAAEVLSERPWLAHYDADVACDVTVPDGAVSELLDMAAATWPSRLAVEFQNQKMTYAALKDKAETFAAALRARGVKVGDRVAIMLPNLPQTFIAFWGVQKAGAIAVMINPLYMESEITHLLSDSGARYLILLDLFWPKITSFKDRLDVGTYIVTRISDALNFPLNILQMFSAHRHKAWIDVPFDNSGVIAWKELFRSSDRLSEHIADPARTPAVIQYTGGTTGLAKGAVLTHRNFRANCEQMEEILSTYSDKKQIFLALLPFFHVFGLTVTLILPARIGAKVVPMPRYVPGDMLGAFKKYKFTAFLGAPSIFISLLQQKNLAKYDLHHLNFCISGSAPLPQEWLKRFEEVTGTRITEGFGLTEACPVTHCNPLHGLQKVGSIGVPLPGTEARIVDMEDGVSPVPLGQPGELVIRGPQVMTGYWNRPEETAVALRDGWLYTGDIATMDADGYFQIVDRKKDLIIVGGYNVYPREIDEILHQHPKIREAVTVGINHRTRGETIKAYIVPKEGETLTVPEVVAFCRQKLASYKVPKLIEFRESLPKSLVGKVMRRLLREEEERRNAESAAAVREGRPDTAHENEVEIDGRDA